MAGSYKHIVNADRSFRGTELIDNLGDAYEALEECYLMIEYLTGGDKVKIFEAWRDGYFKKCCPQKTIQAMQKSFGKGHGKKPLAAPLCNRSRKHNE